MAKCYIEIPDEIVAMQDRTREGIKAAFGISDHESRVWIFLIKHGMMADPRKQVEKERKGDIVGVVGDMHAPFTHSRYFDFIRDTFKRKGVTRVHFAGDIFDNHASSFHDPDPDGMSAGQEMKLAKEQMQKWYKEYPSATVSIGNHDAIPWRKCQSAGMSSSVMATHRKMYGCPTGWRWEDSTVIDGVLYTHGTGNGGLHPSYNLAKSSINSVVIGHAHSAGGVKYHTSKFTRIFGLDVGCGIDVDAYAFAYGKHMPRRPVLGCGIVRYGVEAEFVPMPLERFKK
jgi:hypothetical protein